MITKTGAARWKEVMMGLKDAPYSRLMQQDFVKKPIDYVRGVHKGTRNIAEKNGYKIINVDSPNFANKYKDFINDIQTFASDNPNVQMLLSNSKTPQEVAQMLASAGGGYSTLPVKLTGNGRTGGYIFHRDMAHMPSDFVQSGGDKRILHATLLRHEAEEAARSSLNSNGHRQMSAFIENPNSFFSAKQRGMHFSPGVLSEETKLINRTPYFFENTKKIQQARSSGLQLSNGAVGGGEHIPLSKNLPVNVQKSMPTLYRNANGKSLSNKDYQSLGKLPSNTVMNRSALFGDIVMRDAGGASHTVPLDLGIIPV